MAGSVVDSCTAGTPALDDSLCNGTDDDCDGQTDEDYVSVGTACGIGGCARTGATSCVAGSVVDSCQAGTPAGDDSLCNGADDHCDGDTDEEYASVGAACGIGGCARAGAASCGDGAVVDSCQAGTPAADDSLCNGTDDDCDGQTDEDYVSVGTACGIGGCAED